MKITHGPVLILDKVDWRIGHGEYANCTRWNRWNFTKYLVFFLILLAVFSSWFHLIPHKLYLIRVWPKSWQSLTYGKHLVRDKKSSICANPYARSCGLAAGFMSRKFSPACRSQWQSSKQRTSVRSSRTRRFPWRLRGLKTVGEIGLCVDTLPVSQNRISTSCYPDFATAERYNFQ